ncbi:aspartyl-phosphate phosphatase Spo0E family protein [Clostridium cylindrosporum]|uniref:Spo0E like sporulation regulatory protein n=1 Tax=Clostridium cylindrosporum DSM 605 TaxID=1121307 RepID=A0A0J8D9M5_CLOCY|nr:aspartyl-phosphate phosphatase Spo0E family protein [Clostridium cylindrosporum]KMT22537.1 Spo0E like sporulation regulatory protein [Clostridium cylindrosporum DSM 605]
MEKAVVYKVDFMRRELHKELENCTSLTDARVIVISQLLDEFIVECQKQLISKNYQGAVTMQI